MSTLVSREAWRQLLLESSNSTLITIASFNTLRTGYSFRTHYWVSDEVKQWETRLNLHKELLPIDLGTDVICLQEAEVKRFQEFATFMAESGYEAVEPDAKDKNQHGFTKPSLFYKSSRLTLKWKNMRSRVVLTQFEENESRKSFYVINCHLQGGNTEEKQRCFQIRSALQQLQSHMSRNSLTNVPCFLCGDMNSTVEEPVQRMISTGSVETDYISFSHEFNFEDAYSEHDNIYTFKWGVADDAHFMRLDYIFYTPSTAKLMYIRDPLSEEQREMLHDKCGIPNESHPSDHLPVACAFQLN